MTNRTNNRGQAALVLILLTAAALIFLAITLNWGRIAQTKSLLTVAADESAALLASEAASYGEAQKQTNLKDINQLSGQTGTWLDVLLVIIAIIVAIFTFGMGASLLLTFVAVASVALAVVNLALQVVVVQPMISSMWNSLQKNQPVQQQFYEQGIATALEGSVGDQVNVTDYLDWNTNGSFGFNSVAQPNDLVSRFAIFYTDRLRMLNQPPLPAVVFFYNQLSELMNGESCDQNANDVSLFSKWGVTANPACAQLNCAQDPIDPACEMKIPNGFQLNDACTGSNPNNPATYTPYCDPCCQPQYVPGSNPPKLLRPATCTSGDANCAINNPYGGSYPDLYDPSFQQYSNNVSALDQLGRDQQMGPFSTTLTPQGSANNGLYFPNGVYPFFWLMKDYSPQVDNINPANGLQPSQYHWCTASVTAPYTPPTGFPDLTQLTLPYACSGQDCCVNNILNNVTVNPSVTSNPIQITLTPGPVVNVTSPANGSYFPVGASVTITATASEPGGTIQSVTLDGSGGKEFQQCPSSPCDYTSASTAASTYAVYAVAVDGNGVSATSSPIVINVIDPPTISISGSGIAAGSTATITANAAAPATGDSITSVTFYDNGTSLGTSTASPYTYAWPVPASGTAYNFTAVATDRYGLSTTSSSMQGTVP